MKRTKDFNLMEGFKFIPGFKGMYSIDENGNIYGHRSKKYIVPSINKLGYYHVWLQGFERSDRKHYYLHRLVALTFIENKHNKSDINHIDGDKTNNNVSNLEWCTHKENMQHAYDNKLIDKRRNSPGEWWNWTEEQLQAHEATLNKVAFVI